MDRRRRPRRGEHRGLRSGRRALRRSFHTRAAAAALAGDDVCDPLSSARCWGLPGVPPVCRPSMWSANDVPVPHVVERADGIRLLSPAATWFGLAEVFGSRRFVEWSREVLGDHIPIGSAHRVVAALGRADRAAHRRAAAVLAVRRRWQRPEQSDLERRVRSSLRRRGIVGLDGAHLLETRLGITVHPTVVDHARRWALEVDHRRWHGGRHTPAMRDAIVRDLGRRGWTLVHTTDDQLHRDFLTAMNAAVASHAAT